MLKLDLLYEGRSKKVFLTEDPDLLMMDYKEEGITFGEEEKGNVIKKAVVNNRMTNHIFRMLEEKGIPTHYVQELSDYETVVKNVEIIPVKVVIRNIAAGSFSQKLGIEKGLELLEPTLEFWYKNKELGNPMINDYYAIAVGAATREEIDRITELAFLINEELQKFFAEMGMKLGDLKLEMGRYKGQIVLADEISPDVCRFWKTDEGEDEDVCPDKEPIGEEEAYRRIYTYMGL